MAFGVGALAFGQTVYALIDAPTLAYEDSGFATNAIQAAIILVAFQLASWLYRYTDWSVRSPSRTIFSDETNAALWQLDMAEIERRIWRLVRLLHVRSRELLIA